MTRHTLHVEADPEGLAEVIAEIKRRGYHVECPAFDGRERRQERDSFLRAAHGLMDGTPWGRCVELEREIHRFEALVWPKWRDREAPPEPCSALRSLLFRARRLGPLPGTARQILNIIAKGGCAGDFGEKAFSSARTLERGIRHDDRG